MPIESVMPSSHLILCRPLLLLPPIPPCIRVFSNESTLRMRWPKYWSFSFSINTQDGSPLGWTGWISLKSKGLSRVLTDFSFISPHTSFIDHSGCCRKNLDLDPELGLTSDSAAHELCGLEHITHLHWACFLVCRRDPLYLTELT